MIYLKKFEQYDLGLNFYSKEWENELPEEITILIADKVRTFKKGNIMNNANLIEVIYGNDSLVGEPNEIEFDIYYSFDMNNDKVKLTVEITHGDEVVSDFSVEPPNKVDVIEYTSYHSKFDPSNTVFALDNKSLIAFINYLNKFGHDFHLTLNDLKFLDGFDNYNPNN